MKKIRVAVFGTGFMGRVHTEGIRRLGNVEVAAVAASSSGTRTMLSTSENSVCNLK